MKMTVEQLVKKVESLRDEIKLLEKDLHTANFPITKTIIQREIAHKKEIIDDLYIQEVELKTRNAPQH